MMHPKTINWNYDEKKLPRDFIKRDLFGLYRIDGLIGLYIDDDGWYNLQCVFDEYWLPTLVATAGLYLMHFPKSRV